MSDNSQQALFVDAIRLIFATSIPSADLLSRANAYIFEFSQQRECFFIAAAIASSAEADLSVRAFCASILYTKVRKQIAQLSSSESEQLTRALVALLLATDALSLHNQQVTAGPSAAEARAFLRSVLRSLAALAVRSPQHLCLARETVEHLLAQPADRLGCHLSALQTLAALEEEATECFLSLRQRQPLLRELRQLLGAITRRSLPPLLAWAAQSALSSAQLAALHRSVAEVLRALAQSQGSITCDLAEDGSGPCAQFLVQCATSAVAQAPGDDAVQAGAQANAALRAFFVRSFLLSGGEVADAIDMAAERDAALRLVSAFLHQLPRDTAALSEETRRECIATLLSLCLSGRAVEALSDDAPSGGTPALAVDSAQATLLALLALTRRPPRSALLMTLDGWLDLQAVLFSCGDDSDDSGSDDSGSDGDDGRGMRRSGGALAALDVDEGLFAAPALSPSRRWLLEALLPALLETCVALCHLPLRDGDAVDDDDAWDDVAALRDGRLGLEELAALCVGALGLRRSLALVCAATEAGDLVALEARLFVLATVADRWRRSRDAAVVWPLLDGVAAQAADGASQALATLLATMSRCGATADEDAWRWASDADEAAALRCALFLRTGLRFFASHAKGAASRPASRVVSRGAAAPSPAEADADVTDAVTARGLPALTVTPRVLALVLLSPLLSKEDLRKALVQQLVEVVRDGIGWSAESFARFLEHHELPVPAELLNLLRSLAKERTAKRDRERRETSLSLSLPPGALSPGRPRQASVAQVSFSTSGVVATEDLVAASSVADCAASVVAAASVAAAAVARDDEATAAASSAAPALLADVPPGAPTLRREALLAESDET
eukprot:gene13257-9498_t